MLSATKKSYYSNLDIKKVTDSRTFCRSIIPCLTKRHLKGEKINLIENGKDISNDTELCNIFNGFFSNIISDLNISKKYHCFPNDLDPDTVLSALKTFESHPSIQNTKSTMFNLTFSFENIYTHANNLRIQWKLIFAMVILCSRLQLWAGYFICSKFTPVFF